VKFLIVQFSPLSCYFLLLCPGNFLRTQRVIIGYKRESAAIHNNLNPHKLCGSVKLLLHHCEIFTYQNVYFGVLILSDYIWRYFSV
jgi:hypothetical protein